MSLHPSRRFRIFSPLYHRAARVSTMRQISKIRRFILFKIIRSASRISPSGIRRHQKFWNGLDEILGVARDSRGPPRGYRNFVSTEKIPAAWLCHGYTRSSEPRTRIS
jgi:hypothetical protein